MTSTSDAEEVVLVDEQDNPLGSMEKMRAHREGRLHRAFSVFVFNEQQEMLLQRRASEKYHSPGLWSNACCSHPRPGESVLAAAHRRLQEELGFDCELHPAFSFIYRAQLDGGLVESEFDHVLFGRYSGEPELNPQEADASTFEPEEVIRQALADTPERFTAWFRICIERVFEARANLVA